MNAKCPCQNCNGEFEFDVAEFQESGRVGEMILGQNVPCPHCGKETIIYLKSNGQNVPRSLSVLQQSVESTKETIFFQSGNVAVTHARFIVEGQTFVMRGVTSVESVKVSPNYIWPFILAVIGLVTAFYGFTNYIIIGVAGILLMMASIVIAIFLSPKFGIVLRTAGGEVTAYQSKDQEHIAKVIRALNEAIVSSA